MIKLTFQDTRNGDVQYCLVKGQIRTLIQTIRWAMAGYERML